MKLRSPALRIILCMMFFVLSSIIAFGQYETLLVNGILKNSEYQKEWPSIIQMRSRGITDKKIIHHLDSVAIAIKKQSAAFEKKYSPGRELKKIPSTMATCNGSDIGGEAGTFGSWTADTGVYSSVPTNCTTTGWFPRTLPDPGRIILVPSPSSDPCADVPGFPIPLPSPMGGNYSFMLGNSAEPFDNPNGGRERISYPLSVTTADTSFIYQFALDVENPSGHTVAEMPYFDFVITNQNGDTIPCSYQHYIGGPSIPGFQQSNLTNPSCVVHTSTGPSNVWYKPWTTVGVNLSAYLSQTVTITCTTSDCSRCGHYCYAYLDFMCGTITPTQFCVGTNSVTLTAPSDPGFTYSWSPGGQTTDTITVNPQIVDTVKVRVNPPSGCGFTLTYVLKPTVINPGFSFNQNCNVITFQDTTHISGGTLTNWHWSFPGGNPTLSAAQNPVVTYSTAGTYTASLIVISQAGCTDTITGSPITILPPPVVTANSVSICQGNSATLCASGATSYSWSTSPVQTTTCITVTTASAPTYTVVGTDANGCSANAVSSVVTNAQPNITATGGQICLGGCAPILGAGGVTYSWVPSNGTLSCNNCPNPSACPSVATTYTVTGTNANGCTNTATAAVTILPPPAATTSSTKAGCTVANGTATANVTSGTAPFTYTWNTTPPQTSQTATGLTVGTYSVFIADANGCTNIVSVLVLVAPNPVVSVCCPSTICFGQSTTVLNASSFSFGASYSWTPGTGLSCTTCSTPTASPTFSETYTVTVTDANGCTNATAVPVTVGSIPYISAISSPTICTGDSTVLNANVSNVPSAQLPVSWLWSPPNSLNDSSLQNPTTGAVTTTNYNVTVTDAYGCKDDTTTTVWVQTVPNVSWAEWTPKLTCDGLILPLMAKGSSNGHYTYWSFGDGTSWTSPAVNPPDSIPNPTPHSYPFGGTYSISVTIYNSPCKNILDTMLVVPDVSRVISMLPANVFTPNGDTKNDCFHPAICDLSVANSTTPCPQDSLSSQFKECIDLEVYDRWGIKMFESTDTKKCWDGTDKSGSLVKEGTYYYIAKFKTMVLKGYVELLR